MTVYTVMNFFINKKEHFRRSVLLVRLEGLEPPTYWFVASHSIQLSYRRMIINFKSYMRYWGFEPQTL